MPAPRRIPVLLLAALALLVAGCGGSDKGLLTANQAAELEAALDLAEKSLDADAGGCQTVERRAVEGADAASRLNGVDSALQTNLVDGFNRIAERAEADCAAEDEGDEKPTPSPKPEETVTEEPTEEPTEVPTEAPTEVPTEEPTPVPSVIPPPDETPEEPVEEPTVDTGGAEVPGIGEEDDG